MHAQHLILVAAAEQRNAVLPDDQTIREAFRTQLLAIAESYRATR